MCHWRRSSCPEEKGQGGGQGRRVPKEGLNGEETGVGDRVESPTGAARGSCRGKLASVTYVTVGGRDLAPDLEDGHGDGEDGGPEGAAGAAGRG